MTKPIADVTPNTWEFLRDPMMKPTGFREYDARWKYPDEINLPGMTALGLGLGTQMHKRGIKPVIAVGNDYRDQLTEAGLTRFEVTPEALGLETADLASLAGGEPSQNAETIERVLGGEQGGARTAVVLNAAGAIFVAGLVESLDAGVRLAESSIDDGRAAQALDRLKAATQARS